MSMSWTSMFNKAMLREIFRADNGRSISRNIALINILVYDVIKLEVKFGDKPIVVLVCTNSAVFVSVSFFSSKY